MCHEDVQAVNEFKPDYAGFVFAPSKRRLTVEKAQRLCDALDSSIQRVGIFVNEHPKTIKQVQRACTLDVLQVYQDDAAEDTRLSGTVWRAIRVRDEHSLTSIDQMQADAFVLDAYNAAAYGGTGETFDWVLARHAANKVNIVLAGGLTPDNVQQAIRAVSPYAVDVSSGVETDGVKDERKIKEFINNARSV